MSLHDDIATIHAALDFGLEDGSHMAEMLDAIDAFARIKDALESLRAKLQSARDARDTYHRLAVSAEDERKKWESDNARLRAALQGVQSACRRDDLFRQFDDQGFWHAHHVDIVWRFDGEDRRYEADWLKAIWYLLRKALQREGGE